MSIVILNYSFDLLMLWFCAWCASVSASAWYIWITSNGKHTHTHARVQCSKPFATHAVWYARATRHAGFLLCVHTDCTQVRECFSLSFSLSACLSWCSRVQAWFMHRRSGSIPRYTLWFAPSVWWRRRGGTQSAQCWRCAWMHTPISVSVLRMSLRSQQSVLCTL